MPKAKVTNEPVRPASTTATGATRTPVKVNTGGTPIWYKVIMFGLMLLGLAWLIFYYLAGDQISWLAQLGPWNYAIGFAGMILGLLMTMGWR
ncbi:cell division protein CrgA [Corynebacterium jeddahense]|uniref:Cell division protein CrgA n=1 Tax=Corynebacterium jeddahense TaxID=1414719 RepID=A0ABY7UJF1_9CORY|nr:cell division protein CrgA [Corynebacterium jeddahense]WCZ37668.1 Cell division protein CrgA [Corynebacterium jeddahense]